MINLELTDEIISEYESIKNTCRGKLPNMYKLVCSFTREQAEGDNWRRLDILNGAAELIKADIVREYMKQAGYYFNEELNEWEREPAVEPIP